MFYTYVLKSKISGKFYMGYTSDLRTNIIKMSLSFKFIINKSRRGTLVSAFTS